MITKISKKNLTEKEREGEGKFISDQWNLAPGMNLLPLQGKDPPPYVSKDPPPYENWKHLDYKTIKRSYCKFISLMHWQQK